jgi:hypothetical protein
MDRLRLEAYPSRQLDPTGRAAKSKKPFEEG